MRTIKIKDVPDNLYEALRAHACERKHSVSAEVLSLLEENIPTEEELRKRRDFYRKVLRMQKRKQPSCRVFPSAENMAGKDRGSR